MRGGVGLERRGWRCNGGGGGAGPPVSSVEDGGRADVEEDDCVARAEVVFDCPFHGESAFIAEVYGNGDTAVGWGQRADGCWGGEGD